jgi:DNA-binding CsgD family transcriptional regulator
MANSRRVVSSPTGLSPVAVSRASDLLLVRIQFNFRGTRNGAQPHRSPMHARCELSLQEGVRWPRSAQRNTTNRTDQGVIVPIGTSEPGFLLVGPTLSPIACNAEAVQILTFPNTPAKIRRLNTFLADKVRSSLVDRQAGESLDFVKEFKSGKRRYICRTFRLNSHDSEDGLAVAVLMERHSSGNTALSQISKQFDLTERERQTVELLLQGLTSKEIAARMSISPNTVKAFLRLVMVKMGVSTRSGIVGKVVGPQV